MTKDEALAKAIKLLKLSESDNAHEAALAAQRAQELLAKFGIEQEIVNAEMGNGPEERITNEHDPLEAPAVRLASWKTYLSNVLARANGCRTYLRKVRLVKDFRTAIATEVVVIGRASDVNTVRYLYQLLCQEIDRLVTANTKGEGRTFANNFRLGVVDAISKKLEDAKKAAEEEMRKAVVNDCTALVKVDNAIARLAEKAAAVAKWEKENLKLKNASGGYHRGDAGARNAGQQAGSALNFTGGKGVGASKQRIAG